MKIIPEHGKPFAIPDDWDQVDLGECPNCDGTMYGKQAQPNDEEMDEAALCRSWWHDETPVVCGECGCIASISADGNAWIQEPSEPYEFVVLTDQPGGEG